MASGPHRTPPRSRVPPQAAGPTPNRPLHPAPGAAPGTGEPHLGLPPHPRRTPRARHQGRRIHGVADPQRRRNRSDTPTRRHRLVRLSPLAGRRSTGLRLLRDPHVERHPPVRTRGHRTHQPPNPRPRRHRTPDRILGHPSRQEPRHGPRRRRQFRAVPDPRPRRKVPSSVRHHPRRRGHPGRPHRCPDTANERDHGALDPDLPTRTARPHTHLEPTTPAPHPARVRAVLQHPPTPSRHRQRAATTSTATSHRPSSRHPPRHPPMATTGRHPQRVPPRR
ncbi:hypothetical protein B0I31_102100 [Saccharothrix carnea]|uniref:Uncharacterized protein n=1 Tax=Saccharothrix carnea TaxID=1280637 RepID=A0A2P8IF94_SACCR|nr:hypothetical protein B0I31_102100 [Saccharothrix carnea]